VDDGLRPVLRLLKCVVVLLASKNICISIRIYKTMQTKTCVVPSDNLGLVYLKINGI